MLRITLTSLVIACASAAAVAEEGEPVMLDEVFAVIRAGDAAALARQLDGDPGLAAARDASGVSALSLAAYMERPDLVEVVRARRGAPDFFEAIILGDEAVVRAALAAGQDVDAFAPDGFTPLGLAVFFRRPEIAALLLDRGADPRLQARNAQAVGPIHAAVARNDLVTLERLLLAGVDPDAPQQRGVRPLHGAAANGGLAAAGLLLLFGADPAAKTEEGKTPADVARERGHAALAERLEGLARSI